MSQQPVLPPDVQAALARGDIIAAIKRVREMSGLGLKEAKAIIDAAAVQAKAARAAHVTAAPPPAAHAPMAAPHHTVPTPHGYNPASGLAPGEQPRRSGRWLWIALLLALVAVVIWRR